MSENTKNEKWRRARKKTFIAFCVICFALGFEYSLIFPSLWYYMSSIIKTDYPELFYGIALSAYPASSIIGAFTIARYADHSKRTRLVILLLLFSQIVGNLLYSIYFSPLFPVFGRLIAGLGDVANMVMVGEVSRSYDTNEITLKISWMVMCFSAGFTISPGMNILFQLVDFNIGPIHMVYANMPGLFMAICFILITFLSLFMVSDVSREFDLKGTNELTKLNGDDGKEINGKYNNDKSLDMKSDVGCEFNDPNKSAPVEKKNTGDEKYKTHKRRKLFSTLNSILSSGDLVLLLVFGFVCSYTLFGFDTLVSLIASKYFGFGVSQTSIIFIIKGLLYGIVLLVIGKASTKYSDFYIIIFAIIVQVFGLFAILSLSIYHTNIYFNYACLVVYILAFSTTWSIEEVLSRSLFGKLVPPSCQSCAEGIRRSVSSVAFIIAGITTAGLFKFISSIFIALIVFTLALLVVFICRKDILIFPTPQFHAELDEEEEVLHG